ncbi:MAG TPA: sigma-70 family RNA polymerase sigma factor, partial [Candidatus Limnocylindria bacterium]
AIEPRDGLDLEAELERAELAALVDTALAHLPASSQQVLRERYLEDRSVVEIARRGRTTPDAVSMRLSRGKAALRRLLAGELREQAEAFDLAVPATNEWTPTRVHCSQCGFGTLLMRIQPAPGTIAFRCTRCDADPSARAVEFPLANPTFARLLAGLVRPTAILRRADAWSHAYYAAGMETGQVACTACGSKLPLQTYDRDDLPVGLHRRGLYAECDRCGLQVSTSVSAMTLTLPEARAFRRRHPRLRSRPARAIEAHGRPALVVGYEAIGSTANLEAVFDANSLRLLEVYGPTLTAA